MKFSILYYWFPILCIVVFCNESLMAQKENYTNAHVTYNVRIYEGDYLIDYTFKDQFNQLQDFSFSFPEESTNESINKFGVPNWMLEPYPDTEENRVHRIKVLKNGLFKLVGNVIEVDKNATVDYYADLYCQPVAQQIVGALASIGRDTRRNRIEMAIRFVQDIPYGVPKFADKTKHYGGVNPPPRTLIEMYGDCDSKALLFTGILIFLIDKEDVIFLNQSKHVLTAVKDKPEKGLTYIRYDKNDYLIAETAGPGARLLGEKGNYYSSKFEIETLNVQDREIFPIDNSHPFKAIIPDPFILIKNNSLKNLRFQFSRDNRRWKDFNLPPGESGKFNFESLGIAYLRIPVKKQTYHRYDLETGNSYNFFWNNRKKEWEVN